MLKCINCSLLLATLLFFANFSSANAAPTTPIFESTPPCTLPAPQFVQPTNVKPNSVRIIWAPVSGAISYRVRIKNLQTNEFVGTILTPETFATKTGLLPGTFYQFQVSARCPDGTYSPQSKAAEVRTSIIIVDVIIQRCCPLPTVADTALSGTKDTFCLIPNGTDSYEIKAEKFTSAGTYYEFCLKANADLSLSVSEFAKLNTAACINTGAQLTVKSGACATNFFILNGLDYDISTGKLCCIITWKTKMKVFASYCGTSNKSAENTWITPASFGNGVSVAPNPFTTELRINLGNDTNSEGEVTLFDLNGKIIFRQKSTEPMIVFGTENLPEGIYFLKIQLFNEQKVIRVVKME